jgi:flavin-binding protein dodecin
MTVAKTIEIISSSSTSFEDAVKQGVAKASETVDGVQGAWIQDTEVSVSDNRVAEWRVRLKITFVVK